ncbi:MAG: hypothetical protein II318_01580 [Bacteroidales bacterium]|nr:hypothetical protein [Bacteroidales bacterium]
MFCKYCGAIIDNDSLFCASCGKKLNADNSKNIANDAIWEDISDEDDGSTPLPPVPVIMDNPIYRKNLVKINNNLQVYLVSKLKIDITEHYKCKTCGYIHKGDNAPHKCPLCKASEDHFKKLINRNESIISEWYEDKNGKKITKEYKKIKYLGHGFTSFNNGQNKEIGKFLSIENEIKVIGPRLRTDITYIDEFQDSCNVKGMCKLDNIYYCAKVYGLNDNVYIGDDMKLYYIEVKTDIEYHENNDTLSKIWFYLLFISSLAGLALIGQPLSYIFSLIGFDDAVFFSLKFNIILILITICGCAIAYLVHKNEKKRFKYEYSIFKDSPEIVDNLIYKYIEVMPWEPL